MAEWKIGRMLLATLCVLFLILMVSLLWCDVLTLFSGIQIEKIAEFPILLTDEEYIKVLSCGRNTAKVYFVENNMSGGHILHLERTDGVWSVYRFETVWTGRGGSASGVVFPYIWHCIYGGL